MATQVDIIQSDRVALRVVRNLKLADNPQVRAEWLEATGGKGSIEAWLVDALQKPHGRQALAREQRHHRVTTRRPTRALPRRWPTPSCRPIWTPPWSCGSTRRSSTPASSTSAPRKRAKRWRRRRPLSAFQKEKGIIATDERLDVENARLNELSSQLVQLQALSAESGSRQAQAQGASGDRMQEVLNNGADRRASRPTCHATRRVCRS